MKTLAFLVVITGLAACHPQFATQEEADAYNRQLQAAMASYNNAANQAAIQQGFGQLLGAPAPVQPAPPLAPTMYSCDTVGPHIQCMGF